MRKTELISQVAIRLSEELVKALKEDAEKSGWSLSNQIRYELSKPRGLWKEPYLPRHINLPATPENAGEGDNT